MIYYLSVIQSFTNYFLLFTCSSPFKSSYAPEYARQHPRKSVDQWTFFSTLCETSIKLLIKDAAPGRSRILHFLRIRLKSVDARVIARNHTENTTSSPHQFSPRVNAAEREIVKGARSGGTRLWARTKILNTEEAGAEDARRKSRWVPRLTARTVSRANICMCVRQEREGEEELTARG